MQNWKTGMTTKYTCGFIVFDSYMKFLSVKYGLQYFFPDFFNVVDNEHMARLCSNY